MKGINRRLEGAEEWIRNLEDRIKESNLVEQQKEKSIIKNDNKLRNFSHMVTCNNGYIIGILRRKRERGGAETLFEEIK